MKQKIKNKTPNLIFNFPIIFLIIILLLTISGCKIEGSGDLAKAETIKLNQNLAEKKLTANTSLEKQNITILSSLISTTQNLKQLQNELNNLNKEIDKINEGLENLSEEELETIDENTLEYLNYLNSLTETSKEFTNSLFQSTYIWDNYLSNAIQNHNNLNFSKPINETVFIESFTEPLEAFEKDEN